MIDGWNPGVLGDLAKSWESLLSSLGRVAAAVDRDSAGGGVVDDLLGVFDAMPVAVVPAHPPAGPLDVPGLSGGF